MDKFGKFLQGNASKLVAGIIILIYNIVFFVIIGVGVGFENTHATLWISYAFLLIAVATYLGLSFIPIKNKLSAQTLNSVAALTMGYVALSFVLNLIFMLVNTDDKVGVAFDVVLNVIFLLIYIAMFILAYRRFARVSTNDEKRETEQAAQRFNVVKITTVVNLSKDPDVKAALSKLRMRLNNSSSQSNSQSKEYEDQFNDQLDVIRDLINAEADKEEILRNIEQANAILTARNQVVAIYH